MIKKLKKKNGESLIETMFALLIAVISMSLVVSAALAATKMNESTRTEGDAFEEELEQAELYRSSVVTSKTLRIDLGGGDVIEETVNVYGEGSRFASYKR